MLQDRFITVYSTTSPQDSGLVGYLLPIFQAATGLKVEVAAVGTGEASRLGGVVTLTLSSCMIVQLRTSSSLMGMALIGATRCTTTL
jgi:hypothetical protein